MSTGLQTERVSAINSEVASIKGCRGLPREFVGPEGSIDECRLNRNRRISECVCELTEIFTSASMPVPRALTEIYSRDECSISAPILAGL